MNCPKITNSKAGLINPMTMDFINDYYTGALGMQRRMAAYSNRARRLAQMRDMPSEGGAAKFEERGEHFADIAAICGRDALLARHRLRYSGHVPAHHRQHRQPVDNFGPVGGRAGCVLPEGIQKPIFSDILEAGRFAKIGIPYSELMGPFVAWWNSYAARSSSLGCSPSSPPSAYRDHDRSIDSDQAPYPFGA
jgi:hypothetical protein